MCAPDTIPTTAGPFSTCGHRQDATRGSGFGTPVSHAIALARLDPEMARKELLTLVASQRDDGFIGHMVYWGRLGAIRSIAFAQGPVSEWRRRHTGMIQPPVLAQAVEAVHKASDDGRFLEEILPATSAYYDWIARERDAAGDGLVSIISPFECGLDNSPAFDSDLGLRSPSRKGVLWALRKLDLFNMRKGFDFGRIAQDDRFVVIDPFVNTVYADGLHTLARLHDLAGNPSESARATAIARTVESSLNNHCWDEENGHFTFLHRARTSARPHPHSRIALPGHPARHAAGPDQQGDRRASHQSR